MAAFAGTLILNNQFLLLNLSDALLGVGIVVYIYFYYLLSANLSIAFLYSGAYAAAYGIIRQTVFIDVLKQQIKISQELTSQISQDFFAENRQMTELANQSLEFSRKVLLDYGSAVWFLIIISGVILGSIWLVHRQNMEKELLSFAQPYWTIYPFILAMIFFLIPQQRTNGINLLLIFLPLFIMQGFAVSVFFLRVYKVKRYNLLSFILLIFLNYLYLSLLLLIGIVDFWMQFRLKFINKKK